jgi:hypothetical protein
MKNHLHQQQLEYASKDIGRIGKLLFPEEIRAEAGSLAKLTKFTHTHMWLFSTLPRLSMKHCQVPSNTVRRK